MADDAARSFEQRLVRRARQRDAAAFGELVTRYQDRVYNTCYRMCRNHADAADLTQNAFAKAWRAIDGFEIRASFYTWLFRIVINEIMTFRRRRHAKPMLSLHVPSQEHEVEGAAGVASERAPDHRPIENERRRRIAAALARVDEDFRAAVILKDIEDLDYATIGVILGIPVGTVKSRIHRGRMLLRELLLDEVDTSDQAQA